MLSELKDFKQFLHDAHAGLGVKVNKADIDQLIAVLEAMVLVRTKVPRYEDAQSERGIPERTVSAAACNVCQGNLC
jgi:hypothetical protein